MLKYFVGKPEKLTNPGGTLLESSISFGQDEEKDPKEVGASIFVVGDDSLSPLLAEEDESLISPLPPGAAGLGSVEPVI